MHDAVYPAYLGAELYDRAAQVPAELMDANVDETGPRHERQNDQHPDQAAEEQDLEGRHFGVQTAGRDRHARETCHRAAEPQNGLKQRRHYGAALRVSRQTE